MCTPPLRTYHNLSIKSETMTPPVRSEYYLSHLHGRDLEQHPTRRVATMVQVGQGHGGFDLKAENGVPDR